jgi:hypothetical protein
VVSALPCFEDFVVAGVSGETFDHTKDPTGRKLADVLTKLLRDPGLRERLAQGARAAVARYDVGIYADRLLADFSSLK